MPQIIDPEQFFDQSIFDLLEIQDFPEDKKNKIMKDMMDTINNRVIARVLDLLNENNLHEKFKSLVEENNLEEIEIFLHDQDIDLKKIAVEESLLYKMEIVNTLKK